MGTTIQLNGIEDVMANLKRVNITTLRNAVEAGQMTAAQLENHSHSNAPWVDRTGNARASIYAYVTVRPNDIAIYHGIGVDYGVYLETSNAAKYAVVQPSVDQFRPIWARNLNGILGL